MDARQFICAYCGVVFARAINLRRPNKFCSRRCAGTYAALSREPIAKEVQNSTELQRLYRRRYREKHPEQSRNHYQEIKGTDAYKAYVSEYNAAHKEEARESSRKSAAKHRAAHKDYYRQWRIANPDKITAQHQKRRAAKKSAGGCFTALEWAALKERYGHVCLRCGAATKLTPDHVIPLLRGGSNDIDNIQPLCLPCNKAKSAKSTDYRPILVEELP